MPIYTTRLLNPLGIPKVLIRKGKGPDGTPVITSSRDVILKRIELSLQCMLQAEYGDAYNVGKYKNPAGIMKKHNPSLADIHM